MARRRVIKKNRIVSAAMSCVKVMMVTITTTSFIVYIVSLPDSSAYFTDYAVSDPQHYNFTTTGQVLSLGFQGDIAATSPHDTTSTNDVAKADDEANTHDTHPEGDDEDSQ